jgi:single-strand DNA-binding protein
MTGSVNKVVIIGNLGADPEIKQLDSSRIACRLTVATSRQWKDRESGERKQDVQWHRVVVFDQNAANFARSYLKKGSLVYLEGQVRSRSWEDGAGEKRYTTEIVLSGGYSTLLGLSDPKEAWSDPQPMVNTKLQSDDILWSSTGLDDVPF